MDYLDNSNIYDIRDEALKNLASSSDQSLEAICKYSTAKDKFFGNWAYCNPFAFFASEDTLRNAADYRAARIILNGRKDSIVDKTIDGIGG